MKRCTEYGKISWVALLLPICLVSCISYHDTVAVDINPEGWTEPVTLRYTNTDTLSVKEAALMLRYGPALSPRNSLYIIDAESPSGARARDTVWVSLIPDISGNNLQETGIPYRTNVTFREAGDYIFTVTPAQVVEDMWSAAIDFRKE